MFWLLAILQGIGSHWSLVAGYRSPDRLPLSMVAGRWRKQRAPDCHSQAGKKDFSFLSSATFPKLCFHWAVALFCGSWSLGASQCASGYRVTICRGKAAPSVAESVYALATFTGFIHASMRPSYDHEGCSIFFGCWPPLVGFRLSCVASCRGEGNPCSR